MNNLLNTKIVEVLEKGGYNKHFIKGIMKKNEWLPKNFAFRKDALDLLLARYKKKITDPLFFGPIYSIFHSIVSPKDLIINYK